MPWLASKTVTSPGSLAAQSTKPPRSPALKVVMKKDSPLSTLRLSDFMKPPSAFDCTSTPPDVAIIAGRELNPSDREAWVVTDGDLHGGASYSSSCAGSLE